ncbi:MULTISPECIES: MrpF/PhaF family protein [unclassified Streptomyces]|uniref:MrpF/PhaF family protein n=1 Tax=unclassified Streptomyces TaxID=2593676 RepID=UPI002DDC8134|nr:MULTISPECIES: MrpF/PhaF family protein [unclassified Streptomyces]WSA95057.1 MrpF/PhaF family protein [Streptomyces sp. NBC_01795]WSB79477.1 MrpF/PhaF family protein [Streptomyces sp. NBC_01775]WSS12318.1 MrpF/PhaF family protein [Streptomyces sp. NBC_01186]WSS41030.1 MrpF/PhaF family protein [Streptomyces sp. NBC_01187]
MATEETGGPAETACPSCGGTQVRTVAEARGGKGAMRKELNSRLAPGPEKSGDGCIHFLEGMVITGIGVALAYTGVDQGKPLYTAGGVALAVLAFIGTIAVVRGDSREKSAETAGESLAARVWDPARYCYDCETVFCPGGTPWQGSLTPEQFKKLVWTEACYHRQLGHDKAADAEIPPGTLPG